MKTQVVLDAGRNFYFDDRHEIKKMHKEVMQDFL